MAGERFSAPVQCLANKNAVRLLPLSPLLLLPFILPTLACSHHPLSSSYLPLKSLFQVLDYNDLDPSIVGPCYSGYEVPYPSLRSPLPPSFTPLFPLAPLCLSFYSTIPSGTHPCIHLREQCECKSNIKQLPRNGMMINITTLIYFISFHFISANYF